MALTAAQEWTRVVIDASRESGTKSVYLGTDRRKARRITRASGCRFAVVAWPGKPRFYELLVKPRAALEKKA